MKKADYKDAARTISAARRNGIFGSKSRHQMQTVTRPYKSAVDGAIRLMKSLNPTVLVWQINPWTHKKEKVTVPRRAPLRRRLNSVPRYG